MSSQFDGLLDDDDDGYDPMEDDRLDHIPDSVRSRLPNDPDAIAWEEDFRVKRDENEEVTPVKQVIPGTGKTVVVKPLNQTQAEEWLADGDLAELDDAQIVAILKEFYLQPNFKALGVEDKSDIEDFFAFGLDPLLGALYNASGFDMQRGFFNENSKIMEMVVGNSTSSNGN